MRKIKKVFYFLGRKTSVWLIVGVFAGASMGFAELGLSILLQALLVSLGIIQPDMAVLGDSIVFQVASPTILLIALLGIITVKAGSLFLVSQSSAVTNELINARLRCVAVFDLLNSKSYISAGDINAKVGDTFPKAALFAQQAATGIPALIQCFVLLLFMFAASWKEAGVSLAAILLIGLIVYRTNQQVKKIASQIPKEQRALNKGIERIARNWLLVKILRTAEMEREQLSKNIANYSSHFVRSRLLANLVASLPTVLGGIMLVVIIWLNLSLFQTPGAILLAFLYLLVRFTQQLATFARSIGACSSFAAHFKLAVQYFFKFSTDELDAALHPQRKKEDSELKLNLVKARLPQTCKAPSIEIKDLSFRYKPTLPYVIQNLNLQVQSGEQFGIVGRSGSGKSTLLGLILGVLEPSDGMIRIDGHSPSDYFKQKEVRVGYVGAEAFLIEGSIKENLAYGSRFPEVYSDREYWEALRMAKLDESIRGKPEQLNYRLRENGEGLSAGQKQRLGLARAFLAHPQVLILDEASANLDEETEREITESIQTRKGLWTVLIVSHRSGLLLNSAQVFDFNINQENSSYAEKDGYLAT